MYEVFGPKFCHFSHMASEMKVIQLFKAKMEAFRERKCEKVKNDPFLLHLTLCFCGRDENRFFSVLEPETLRKPMLLGAVC